MPSSRQRRGSLAEDQAADFLHRRGYKIIGRHVSCRYGEIDILAKDGTTLVAVEVKTRSSTAFGRPEDAVTPAKIQRIVDTLNWYLDQETGPLPPTRIDVIAINRNQIELFRDIDVPSHHVH